MAGEKQLALTAVGVALSCLFQGCQLWEPRAEPSANVTSSLSPASRIPEHIARLAVVYPHTTDRDVAAAYLRLAGATFLLKTQRPSLQIVERSDLSALLDEQRLQMGGRVSDRTAVRLGRFLGADGVLLYRIEGPNLRDRVFAKYSGDLPPFLFTSKIIMVESAEVVFYNVVVAQVEGVDPRSSLFFSESRVQPLIRAALDRGVDRTAADLWRAFR
ncbi:hypothetical protein [Nitrospira sp. Kam-Ns4a]